MMTIAFAEKVEKAKAKRKGKEDEGKGKEVTGKDMKAIATLKLNQKRINRMRE